MTPETLKDLQETAKKLEGDKGNVAISAKIFCELVAMASGGAKPVDVVTPKKP